MFGESWKSILKMMAITCAVMWSMNRLAAINPTARRLIKRSVVTPVGNQNQTSTVVGV